MTCQTIMTRDPVTVRANETLGTAAQMLIAHRCIHLAVVDETGKFAGLFGIYDLLSALVPRVALAGDLQANLRFVGDDPDRLRKAFHEMKDRPVGEVADRGVVTLAPQSPAAEAFKLFCRKQTTLAIVEPGSGKLAGIVSYWDAVRAIAAADQDSP